MKNSNAKFKKIEMYQRLIAIYNAVATAHSELATLSEEYADRGAEIDRSTEWDVRLMQDSASLHLIDAMTNLVRAAGRIR